MVQSNKEQCISPKMQEFYAVAHNNWHINDNCSRHQKQNIQIIYRFTKVFDKVIIYPILFYTYKDDLWKSLCNSDISCFNWICFNISVLSVKSYYITVIIPVLTVDVIVDALYLVSPLPQRSSRYH